MPGIFGFFDYTKEGPGVPVNAPVKGPFKLFFEILFRKFWKLVTINLMYVVFSIPALLIAFFLVTPILLQFFVPGLTLDSLQTLMKDSATTSTTAADLASAASYYMALIYVIVSVTSVGLSYVVVGPVQAGVTYLLRNYAREEHAFVWMDFKESAKSNFKQSSIVGLISLVAILLLAFDYNFFSGLASPVIQGLLSGLILVLSLLATMMLMYLYPMIVTFKLPLGKMFRNALLLTVARFLPNLGILALDFFLLFVLPILFAIFLPQGVVIFMIIFYCLLAFSLTLFLNNFFVYRQFRKFMLDKAPAAPTVKHYPNTPDDDFHAVG